MASFRSSFDPCNRSATAAAATAPAASGIVCRNVNMDLFSQTTSIINAHLINQLEPC